MTNDFYLFSKEIFNHVFIQPNLSARELTDKLDWVLNWDSCFLGFHRSMPAEGNHFANSWNTLRAVIATTELDSRIALPADWEASDYSSDFWDSISKTSIHSSKIRRLAIDSDSDSADLIFHEASNGLSYPFARKKLTSQIENERMAFMNWMDETASILEPENLFGVSISLDGTIERNGQSVTLSSKELTLFRNLLDGKSRADIFESIESGYPSAPQAKYNIKNKLKSKIKPLGLSVIAGGGIWKLEELNQNV